MFISPQNAQYFQLYSIEKAPEIFTIPSLGMIKHECLQIETSFPCEPYGPADIDDSFFTYIKEDI